MLAVHVGATAYNKADYYGIKCLRCNRISYNYHDIQNLYCGGCHEFGHLVKESVNDQAGS